MAWSTRLRLTAVCTLLIAAAAFSIPAQATAYTRCACTDWAHRQRPDLPRNLGNALTWGARARAAGFPVDGNPRAGDIMVLQPGVQGAHGRYGHVAYVTGVGGGKVYVTEFNGTCRVINDVFRVTRGVAFIHHK